MSARQDDIERAQDAERAPCRLLKSVFLPASIRLQEVDYRVIHTLGVNVQLTMHKQLKPQYK